MTGLQSCHGVDGAPNEKIAAAMKVEMRHLGAKEVRALSDAQLKTIITEGKGKMKPASGVSRAAMRKTLSHTCIP